MYYIFLTWQKGGSGNLSSTHAIQTKHFRCVMWQSFFLHFSLNPTFIQSGLRTLQFNHRQRTCRLPPVPAASGDEMLPPRLGLSWSWSRKWGRYWLNIAAMTLKQCLGSWAMFLKKDWNRFSKVVSVGRHKFGCRYRPSSWGIWTQGGCLPSWCSLTF